MLSSRGERCTAPALPYWSAFARALADPYNSSSNRNGAIPLCVAENKLSEPSLLLSKRLAAVRVLEPNVLGYDDMRGRTSLRTAFASLATRRLTGGAFVDGASLCVSAGCGALIAALANVLMEEGDAMLLPVPTYGALYNDFNVLAGVRIVDVPRPHGFDGMPGTGTPSIETLDAALDAAQTRGLRVRAIFLINPDNPTGAIMLRTELTAIILWARRRGLHIIVDEIYALSVWGDDSGFTSAAEILASSSSLLSSSSSSTNSYLGDDVHILWGFSKDFAASGLRAGILFTHNVRLLEALSNIGYFMTVSNDTQDFLATIVNDENWIDDFFRINQAALKRTYHIVIDALKTLNIPYANAKSGMFVWLSLCEFLTTHSSSSSSCGDEAAIGERELNQALWDEEKLVLTPGEACHATEKGWFRICYAWPSEEGALDEALRRLGHFVTRRRDGSRLASR